MSDKEVLNKAINKAIKNGFDKQLLPSFYLDLPLTFIFSQQFAKALWGEEELDNHSESEKKNIFVNSNRPDLSHTIKKSGWQHHLQMMVVSNDPIKYLGENM